MIDFIKYMLDINNFFNSIRLLGWWILSITLVYLLINLAMNCIVSVYEKYLEMKYAKFVAEEEMIKYHSGIKNTNELLEEDNNEQ